ncbi:MAG: F0F1 ATP synthase subunit A [Deltaproteobacteria bacterium]|nr:F0F1 ATP synthase subunit A [Deltaproteobacteria bacterium]MBW2597887.1 F0F1 ATP synthase subunit A [Deltaproteobacteria bacterium]MBW2639686.1 F0F1 ATP synthase subunit A [Deltaproteobacteria bacterium]
MEHPYLFFIKLFELIGLGHFAHSYPHIVYSWVVMIILIVLGFLASKSVSLVPTKVQNLMEIIISALEEFTIDITGEEGRWLFPLLATIFLYIFTCNIIGLIPGFYPPTASLNTTLSCALIVVLFTHVIGIKYHGVKYIKHFLGPVWWMVPLIFPIELIGHLARILSLSFRLMGNMMGHELVAGILFALAGLFFAPLPIMVLGIFVALVQAFVFYLLSVMYFTGALEHAH